jgi:effector-binding domain-containing protein
MEHVADAYQALLRWTDDTDEHIIGYSREIYLDCSGPPNTWTTELQFALQ